ncbi:MULTISPECIES: hypothetical protein [Pseudomonas]|uniref:hypothetical protein n=1 Tax=Pseudomonas TaxID=286 RepID=UPI001E365ED9|nr:MULTISPECIES: hypothetical protein [Pseudomonas]MCE1021386.1 hypothetical protein [Pseudomonas monteilii]MDH0640084.1 hypothetical protein [Pseudomonas sp. GD03860]MDM9557289.1 hypothetical protein [Pseudomonas asiatica]HCE0607755.1 hypothetical protein [Pseudomonas aeruginosa]
MSFDALIFPGDRVHSVSIHNVTLVGGQLSEDGVTPQMIVEYQGKQHVLRATRPVYEKDIGKVGYVLPSQFPSAAEYGSTIFRAYQDQSLRRVYELDTTNDEYHMVPLNHGKWPHHRAHLQCGWRCDSRPTGFLAPAGLVPGANGEFVPDETEVVSVRIPPEFEWEARRHQMKAADLLESFIGDLAGIQNYANKPRADRFGSNGSDERMLAENWLERAHGMKAIDLDQLSQQIEEAEEWDAQQDEWSELLGEYADRGGDPRQLLEAVDGVLTKLDELGPDFVLDLQAEVEATQTLPKLTELNPSQLAYLEKWLASNGPNNLLKWPGWHDARLGQAPKDV